MATINGDDSNNFLTGTEEEDIINGLGGNDTIDSVDRPSNIFEASIDPRRDVVNAGTGDDFVTGGKLDQLDGGDGNDFLQINFNFNGPIAGSATPITLALDANGTGTASDGTFITGFESVNFTLSDTGDNVVNTGNVRAQITGGNGNDTLTTGSSDDVVFGGGGNNVISTGGGSDTISGGSGNDIVSGGDGDDNFGVNVYTDGSDQVNLGAGNDTVRFDRFDGGSGNIRLTFTSAEVGNGNINDAGTLANQDGGLAVRVQAEAVDGSLTGPVSRYDDEGTTFVAGTQGITFDVRDLVSGTARGDTFEGVVLGTSGNDALSFFPPFRAGQDFYYNAGQGDDTVTAGDGNDFLVGGSGNDTLLGGGGNDSFIGGGGADVIEGGAGADTAIFNVSTDGADSVNLDSGSDRINVSAASAGQVRLTFTSSEVGDGSAVDAGTMSNQDSLLAVRLQAEAADGTLTGPISRFDDEGSTFVASSNGLTFDVRDLVAGTQRGDQFRVASLGTNGADTIGPVAGFEAQSHYVNAGQGNDTVTGGSADDFLVGGAGDDILNGVGGNDSFLGGAGNDQLNGGAGTDNLDGGAGDDLIGGGSEADILTGGLGNDTLQGDDGNDTLTGGDGNDFLFGGNGADILDGGLGNDVYYNVDSSDTVTNESGGVDTLITSDAGVVTAFSGNGAIENLIYQGTDSIVYTGSVLDNIVQGSSGADNLDGGVGNDVLAGGGGNDRLVGNVGNDAVAGEAGNDLLFGGVGDDGLDGGAGDDQLSGEDGNDALQGGEGNDALFGGSGDDLLVGGEGGDLLNGDQGRDTLLGGAGDDQLFGGLGDDVLVGGAGNDTFVFDNQNGFDIVTDFGDTQGNQDVLLFAGGVFTNADQVLAATSQVIGEADGIGDDLRIDLGNGNQITLLNTAFSSLDASDFLFA